MIDMSSTQALLNMVRTANAQNQAQLDSYLKGASSQKRSSESSPLDLSSAAPVSKKVKRERDFAESFLSMPLMDVLRTKGKSAKKSSAVSLPARCSPTDARPESRSCSAESEQHSIAHWTVDDVCSFVTGIDICAEYEKVSVKITISWMFCFQYRWFGSVVAKRSIATCEQPVGPVFTTDW